MDTGDESNFSAVLFINNSLGGNGSDIHLPQNESSQANEVVTLPSIMYIGISVCLSTLIVNSSLCTVLKRCRKMPLSLRWMSLNFVANTMILYATLCMMLVVLLMVDQSYFSTVFDLRMLIIAALYNVCCGSTAGLTLERYIKLSYPYKCHDLLSKRNIIVYIICIWVIGLILPLSIYTKEIVTKCDQDLKSRDFSTAFYAVGIVFSVVLTSICLLLLGTSIKVRKITNAQRALIMQFILPQNVTTTSFDGRTNLKSAPTAPVVPTHQSFRATNNVIKISLVFVLSQIPLILNGVIVAFFPALRNAQISMYLYLQTLCLFCILISSYTASYVFIWKFKECKMHFLNLCCSRNKWCKNLAQRLHNEVFDIVTAASKPFNSSRSAINL